MGCSALIHRKYSFQIGKETSVKKGGIEGERGGKEKIDCERMPASKIVYNGK